MLQLIVPSLPPSFFEREKRGLRWMAGFFFCLLTLVSTDRDRPDELALVWGLLLCLVLTSAKKNSVKAILSPVLLALVGATSPACGVLFALVLFFWCLGQKNRFRLLLPVGAGTLFCWGLIVLPVLAGDLGSGFRFSKQAGLSTFPYLRDLAASWRWTDLMAVWVRYLGLFWKAGKSYILFAMGTMGMGLGLIARFGRDLNSLQRTCMYSAIAYCVLAPMIWTLQPYYLWFSGVLLLVGVFQMAGKMKPFGQRTVLTACFLFVSPLWFWEFKCVLNALEVPGEERSDEIRKQVLAEIDPSAKLAVTHDQYFTFRKNKEVVNVAYWINEANQFDYLYITDLPDSRRQTPRIRQLLSDELRPCFELVKDFSTHTPFRLMGYQTRHFVRGNGGGLFKNICKNTPQNS
ncbi:hypothetical protein EBT16_03435 [bacterium]|nr:hypothetical protein [bacterium]